MGAPLRRCALSVASGQTAATGLYCFVQSMHAWISVKRRRRKCEIEVFHRHVVMIKGPVEKEVEMEIL